MIFMLIIKQFLILKIKNNLHYFSQINNEESLFLMKVNYRGVGAHIYTFHHEK